MRGTLEAMKLNLTNDELLSTSQSVRGMPPEPDKPVRCIIHKRGGDDIEIQALHTFSPEQVKWFKAGSALNVVKQKVKRAKK